MKVRYCDGASFTGDSENKVCKIYVPLFSVCQWQVHILLSRRSTNRLVTAVLLLLILTYIHVFQLLIVLSLFAILHLSHFE